VAAQAPSATPTPLRVAFEARDHDALVAALAPDVVLWSPIFDVPFRGIDEASDLFAVVLEVFGPVTYTAEVPAGDRHILAFRTTIGKTELEGVDVLRFDDQGRVKEITVFFRPFRGVAAFLRATGPKLGRRRGGAARAAALAAGAAPLTLLMRATAATGPGLLRIGHEPDTTAS
jgi:SnoaL-like protein